MYSKSERKKLLKAYNQDNLLKAVDDRLSRLRKLKRDSLTNLYFKSSYKTTGVEGLSRKEDKLSYGGTATETPFSHFNTYDKGLTSDKGLTRYYPNDLYPNYEEELNRLYNITPTGEEYYFPLPFSGIRNSSREPITNERYFHELRNKFYSYNAESFKGDKYQRRFTKPKGITDAEYDSGEREKDKRVTTTSHYLPEFNIGIVNGIVYTTTLSIPLESFDTNFKNSGIEIPCRQVVADMLIEILTSPYRMITTREKEKLDNGAVYDPPALDGYPVYTRDKILNLEVQLSDIPTELPRSVKFIKYFEKDNPNHLTYDIWKVAPISLENFRTGVILNIVDAMMYNSEKGIIDKLPRGTIVPLLRLYKDSEDKLFYLNMNRPYSTLIPVGKHTIDPEKESHKLDEEVAFFRYIKPDGIKNLDIIEDNKMVTDELYVSTINEVADIIYK